MRAVVILWLSIGGVSGAAWAQPGSQPVSAQQAALAWLDAVEAGDLATADKGCVGFAAWKAISKRALDPESHRARHRGFVRGLHRQLTRGATVAGLVLEDVLILPAGIKRHRSVVMAVFHLGLRFPKSPPGKTVPVPLLFLRIDDGWFLMVRD